MLARMGQLGGADPAEIAKAMARSNKTTTIAAMKQASKANKIISPGSLYATDVPPILRSRIEIPAARKFWIGLYHCNTCDKKVYEVEIQKKKHEGHDYVRKRIISKGVQPTWDTNFRLCMGPGARIAGNALHTPSIAITAPPIDSAKLRRQGDASGLFGNGFHWVMLLPVWLGDFDKDGRPVKKPIDIQAEKKRLEDALEDCEKIIVLPSKPREIIPAIFQFLKELDPDLLDPENSKKADAAADETELYKQLETEGLYKSAPPVVEG